MAKTLDQVVGITNIAHAMTESLWLGNREHKTIYVNPAFEKLSGYTLKEAIGKDCLHFFDQGLAKSSSLPQEAILITKSGDKVPLLISGSQTPTGETMWVFSNLTKLKKLTQQDKLAQQIIQHSTEAIVVLDTNRKIKLWNSGAVKMYGYKATEVINTSINILIPKEEEAENKILLSEVRKHNQIKNIETKRLTKDGQILDVSLSVTKVMGEKERFIGYLIIYRDISQEKRANTELQKRFEAIQDAYKELGLQKRYLDYMSDILDVATAKDTSIKDLERIIISAFSLLTKCDSAILRFCDSENKFLKLRSSFGVNSNWDSKDKVLIRSSIAHDAYKKGRALIIDDIDSYRKHQGQKLLKAHSLKSLILVPLIVGKHFVGSISLYATDPAKFRLIESDFLEKMGKQCSVAIFTKMNEK